MGMDKKFLIKWYSRIIGIFFVLVSITLFADYINFGFRAETMHKIFHVIVGVIVLKFGWNNKRFWLPFCFVNGGFFTFVAIFGWLFPNYAGLDAFNMLDTILHTIVGASGLLIGSIYSMKK